MADDVKPTIGGMLEAAIAEQRAALQKLESQERARWWAALMADPYAVVKAAIVEPMERAGFRWIGTSHSATGDRDRDELHFEIDGKRIAVIVESDAPPLPPGEPGGGA